MRVVCIKKDNFRGGKDRRTKKNCDCVHKVWMAVVCVQKIVITY